MDIAHSCRALALPLLLAVLAGCGTLGSGGKPQEKQLRDSGTPPLSGRQVRALLENSNYQWEGNNGARGFGITSGDGRLRIGWETGAVNGRIRFTDTGYCSRFKALRNNEEHCYRLYPAGPRRYTVFRTDGQFTGHITIVLQRN